MQATLHEDLIATNFDRFFDFFQNEIGIKYVGFAIANLSVKRTKVTYRRTDIRIVDISINIICPVRFRVQATANHISSFAKFMQPAFTHQDDPLVISNALALSCLLQDFLNDG